MADDLSLLANLKAGAVYRTRDRREARIDRLLPGEGLIFGEVQMHGPCVWLANGRYRDAPFGAPGPLDLLPPAEIAPPAPRTVSMKDALEGDNRLFCCD